MLSNNHDNSLCISGWQIGVDGSIDNKDVIGSEDLGVGVDDSGAIICLTHDCSSDKVRALNVTLGCDHRCTSETAITWCEDSAVLGGVEDLVDHCSSGSLIVLSIHPWVSGENSCSLSVDSESTN